MADRPDTYEMAAVDSNDILPDRQSGWDAFTRATTWAVVVIAGLLIALKVLFG